MSCFYDLAERYRLRNLIAERDMAAQNKLFQRLIWLADTVYSAKHITMAEIDRIHQSLHQS